MDECMIQADGELTDKAHLHWILLKQLLILTYKLKWPSFSHSLHHSFWKIFLHVRKLNTVPDKNNSGSFQTEAGRSLRIQYNQPCKMASIRKQNHSYIQVLIKKLRMMTFDNTVALTSVWTNLLSPSIVSTAGSSLLLLLLVVVFAWQWRKNPFLSWKLGVLASLSPSEKFRDAVISDWSC